MSFYGTIKEYLEDFVNLIFPRICINCHTILVYQEEHICIKCRLSLPKTEYHLRNDNLLEQKFVYEPKVKSVAAYLYFNKGGVAQKMIHELKYRGQTEIGVTLGRWYGNDLKKVDWSVDYILPVPLHKSKQNRRGFNQSEKFAEGLGEAMELEVKSDVAQRIALTATQTKKSKVERWQNVASIYQITDKELVADKNILVVDDVLTTGATIGELISVLAASGAKGIYIATIAAGR